MLPNDEFPYHIGAERVVCLDQNIEAIDGLNAGALAEVSARKFSARLSFLMDTGLYLQRQQLQWVSHTLDGAVQPSVRAQRFFHHDYLQADKMPKKGNDAPAGKFSFSLSDKWQSGSPLQSLPRETRLFLRTIDKVDATITEAFDRCARLYQVALICGRSFPSVGLAYRVAAVEALSAADRTCDGFSAFMRKYVTAGAENQGLLEYLYRVARSAHFHAGTFQLGEFSAQPGYEALMDIDRIAIGAKHRLCFEITREAIANWMMSILPQRDDK
nr:hypothetical protein [uncultured Massilia sp.]